MPSGVKRMAFEPIIPVAKAQPTTAKKRVIIFFEVIFSLNIIMEKIIIHIGEVYISTLAIADVVKGIDTK